MLMPAKDIHIMKINQFPKQENVIEVDLGAHQIAAIPVTDENREYLVEAAFSTYLGEQCKYCGKTYQTLDDLKDTVWAGVHEHGRLACRSCWSANNKAGVPIAKHAADPN
jgi:hypothetical protein